MTNETKHVHTTGHDGFERRDIQINGVLYFLLILAAGCIVAGFAVEGLYKYLDKRIEADQPTISPLVTNVPKDTRHLPNTYDQYLKQNFPAPQLEINERDQLDSIRLDEEDTLATYGWVDQKSGKVRIPIERAMDLIVQRGLPVRPQNANESTAAGANSTKK